MKHLRWLIWLFGLGAFTTVTAAQDQSCPAIVEQALSATEQACEATGRNQACYGNSLLEAVPQADSNELAFRERGDLVDLVLVRSLTLSPMDVEADVWGVSLMRIQANLPDTLPGQNVTMLMFGDVEVRVPTNTEPVTIDVTATGGLNIRRGPSTSDGVIGGLSLGQTATVNGRLEDGSWLRIILPDDEETYGWVFAELVATEDDVSLLAVIDPAQTASAPTQAFYFRTGIGDAPCAEAPNSGLLIQTPAGAGMVSFRLNDVNIQLGSTAYLQAVPGEEMGISVINEGIAIVESFGVEQKALSNMQISVPLDDNLAPSGPPSPPEMCKPNELQALPGGHGDCGATLVAVNRDCPATIPFDMDIKVELASGGYSTEAEAREAMGAGIAAMTINGQSVPVLLVGTGFNEFANHWGYNGYYDWLTPSPGVYTVEIVEQNGLRSCTVTILEPPS